MKTGTARGVNDVEHLADVVPAGIELLQLGVERVIAVFGDQRHSVHHELAAAQGERIGDRGTLSPPCFLALARPRSVASGVCSIYRLAISKEGLWGSPKNVVAAVSSG